MGNAKSTKRVRAAGRRRACVSGDGRVEQRGLRVLLGEGGAAAAGIIWGRAWGFARAEWVSIGVEWGGQTFRMRRVGGVDP